MELEHVQLFSLSFLIEPVLLLLLQLLFFVGYFHGLIVFPSWLEAIYRL
jgi:hypothetical protein